ncbi:MAG: hypothetical protein QG650_241 [Patescibacteria group bacterium]|nr:hypothetical protein [Patescibacteria group bacterium]
MGSNPPRDKCYLTIAENTGNYSSCDKIAGGPMSYSKTECVSGTAMKKDDPEGCKKLSNSSSEYAKCVGAVASPEKIKARDAEFEKLRESLSDDPQDKELRAKYEAAKKDLNSRYEMMDPAAKSGYFKARREETMKDVEDEDVRQSIAKDFNQYKAKNPNASFTDMVNSLDETTDRQKLLKDIDENANRLVDDMKGKLSDYVDGKMEDAQGAAADKAGEWIDKNASESMKYQLQRLSSMKEKYDKASETYKDLQEKYGKVKAVYDEAVAIQSKVKEFDKMVGEGKIDEKQAKVLKGAVILGKGLEYVTGYVPVFGSTVSTISKETFETVVKVATKRAERSHGLDNCMSDPEHCDPDGISAY